MTLRMKNGEAGFAGDGCPLMNQPAPTGQARAILARWVDDYNTERRTPRSAMPPRQHSPPNSKSNGRV